MFLKITKTLIITQRFKNRFKYTQLHNYAYTFIQVNLCYLKNCEQDAL